MKRLSVILLSFACVSLLLASGVPPTAVITKTPNQSIYYPGESITFGGTSSYDNDEGGASITAYEWRDENNVVVSTSSSYVTSFTLSGGQTERNVQVKLRVKDDENTWGETTITIKVIAKPVRYYYIKDHLGSIRVTVKEDNTIAGWDDYYPFGMTMAGRSGISGQVDAGYKFTEKERDIETGYDYFGARYYDSRIARWLTVDPMGNRFPDLSPYNYVKNNPLRLFDPDGQFPYTFYVRSFHPEQTFGGGFLGDNRRASNNPSSSSRIGHYFTFDPSTGQTLGKGFQDNFSMHPAGFGAAAMYAPSLTSLFFDKASPTESRYNVTGEKGSYNIVTGYSGANPLVPSFDIDVHSAFQITEDLAKGILSISANISGDAFPSAEAFIVDQSGNSAFIGISNLQGNVVASLFGENYRSMISVTFQVSIDNNGNFTGIVVGDKRYSLEEWNKLFQ